jgi:hypothetical protein
MMLTFSNQKYLEIMDPTDSEPDDSDSMSENESQNESETQQDSDSVLRIQPSPFTSLGICCHKLTILKMVAADVLLNHW